MARLFFWTNYYMELPDVGTTEKIRNEIKTLRVLGFNVYYTAYVRDGVAIYDDNDKQVEYLRFHLTNSKLIGVFRKDYLVRISRDFLEKEKFDFFLLRINYFSHKYMQMLREMKRQNSFVMMESLSYFPGIKYSIAKAPKLYAVVHSLKWQRKKIAKVVDLMLTEGRIDDYYGIPCIEFGMGVNVQGLQPHHYNGRKDVLNLIMVGCTSVYHGTDRIIASLKNYYENPANQKLIILHLVGEILDKDKKLISESNLESCVVCYGRRYGKELEEIYDKCNISLGPLAQHRMQKKDTGLKTKEYFAKGIPYIYTGDEVCIEDGYPFIFQVPDNEELIDLNDVWSFYEGIRNNEEMVESMRQKAIEVFSWTSIFEKVLDKAKELGAFDKKKSMPTTLRF